jgi:hypothetical protein
LSPWSQVLFTWNIYFVVYDIRIWSWHIHLGLVLFLTSRKVMKKKSLKIFWLEDFIRVIFYNNVVTYLGQLMPSFIDFLGHECYKIVVTSRN